MESPHHTTILMEIFLGPFWSAPFEEGQRFVPNNEGGWLGELLPDHATVELFGDRPMGPPELVHGVGVRIVTTGRLVTGPAPEVPWEVYDTLTGALDYLLEETGSVSWVSALALAVEEHDPELQVEATAWREAVHV